MKDFGDTSKLKETSGYERMKSYLEGIIEEPEFQKQVLRLRKKYKLPPNGQPEFPMNLYSTDFFKKVDEFGEKLGLDEDWMRVIQHYILHNEMNIDVAFHATMFEIMDINYELNSDGPYLFRDQLMPSARLADLKEKTLTHPVAILITPYSSERNIVDYVKKMYKTFIEPIQLAYRNPKVKIGKIRKRSRRVKDRNQFIFENRNLSKEKLVSLVATRFGKALDYTYINSILAREKKKRT